MNNEFKDYYRILGVTPDASQENIERARERELSQNWSNPIGRLQIEEAYAVLSNPVARRNFDAELERRLNERQMAMRNSRNSSEFEASMGISSGSERTIETETIDETKTFEPSSPAGASQSTSDDKTDDKKQGKPESEEKEQSIEEEKEDEQKKEKTEEKEVESKKVESSTPSKNEDIEKYLIPVTKDPSVAGKRKKLLIVAGVCGYALLGLPSVIIGAAIAPKLIKKMKLHKDKKEAKRISKANTEETRLIEEYNQQLEAQIYELLGQPNQNYKLEIARLKYANQVELLQKRIEFKENQKVKKSELFKYKMELWSLRKELKRAQNNLENLNKRVVEYNKGQGLAKLNDRLIDRNKELFSEQARKEELDKELKKFGDSDKLSEEQRAEKIKKEKERRAIINSIKNLDIKVTAAVQKRDKKATKLALSKGSIAFKQALIARFPSKKGPNEAAVIASEQVEENVKTR